MLTPKSDPTQLRMNIDMTTANTAIKRTRHVIPTLEELRYKLNGAKHFIKLDMKLEVKVHAAGTEARVKIHDDILHS